MKIKTGVDLIKIDEFKKSLTIGGENFLHKCFFPSELNPPAGGQRIEHLAGIFASKEAVIKAFSFDAGSWLNIEISNYVNGKPQVKILNLNLEITSMDLSISHQEGFVLAFFVVLL